MARFGLSREDGSGPGLDLLLLLASFLGEGLGNLENICRLDIGALGRLLRGAP
jgi:hypothetical protein